LSENLTPKQKIVFVLKDIEGMETNEIEEISGMNAMQIKSNLHLARQQIRKQLIQMAYEVR
jgi:RNA polymerase sigma-70 factor (ECF subfamily)